MPIDVFFSSLAEVHQSHAIGVVLSGTGVDGTLGLKNIKAHGGLTFAQDVDTAAYNGMPQSAIDAEVVDFILAPEKMPQQLLQLNRTYNILPSRDDASPDNVSDEQNFREVLNILRIRKGVDFTYYKQTTVRRRILRRGRSSANQGPKVPSVAVLGNHHLHHHGGHYQRGPERHHYQ